MAGLESIPKELQLSIVEYVTSNEDKKSLCLANKALQRLVTPLLYKDMVISPKKLSGAFEETLTAKHPGIAHVRSIRVDIATSTFANPTKLSSEKVSHLLRLVSAIPRDRLARFELPTTSDVDYALDLLVHNRHPNVSNYQYHSPAWRDPRYAPPQPLELAHITCLQLYTQHVDNCDLAGTIINSAPLVRNLALEFDCRISDDIHTRPSDIVSRILTPIDDKLPRVGLKTLRISSFSVHRLAEYLSEKVSLRGLKHLQLVNCNSMGGFIQMLSQLDVDLVSYYVDFGWTDSSMKRPNEEILRLMTTPKRFTMSSSSVGVNSSSRILCDWAVVTARAASLLSFSIDDNHTDADPFFLPGDLLDFYNFCGAAANLEQLSVSCPPVEKDYWGHAGGFDALLDCLRQVRTLKVLRLITHSSYRAGTHTSPEAGTSKHVLTTSQCVLKTVADRLFQTLGPACPKLLAVVLDIQGDLQRYYRWPFTPYAFLRTKQPDTTGRPTYAGAPIEAHMVKHHVPCFDLLDPPAFIYD